MKKLLFLIAIIGLIPVSCNLNNKDEIIILYTNDVHASIDGTQTYATVAAMKKELKNNGKNVLLFDSGDHISGGLYARYDDGKSIVDLMSMAEYDAATLGNHEFDYEFSYLIDLMKQATFPYLSANFYNMKDGKVTTRFTENASKIFTFNNTKIGVIGVSTPESITTSSPSHFQDKDGNYIYTFRDNDLYSVIQNEINSIKPNCDYIICLSHLGDDDQSKTFTSTKLINNTIGIDIVLDGHTHQVVEESHAKDKNGKDVLIVQTGSNFKNIGQLTISKDGKFTNKLISDYPFVIGEIRNEENKIINAMDERFKTEIATSEIAFKYSEKYGEYNLGDLVAEAPYYYFNETIKDKNVPCDFTFVNTGGIRSTVEPGTWTLKTCFNIHSFTNASCVKSFSGSTIKKALEFSVRKAPDNYFGGFQQTCGIKFKVDTSKTSEFEIDNNGGYISGPKQGTERVYEIQVYDKTKKEFVDFDETKTYNVAGTTYVLNECGDGMNMFKEGKLLYTEPVLVDYLILANYIKNFANNENALPKIEASNSPLRQFETYDNLDIDYSINGANRIIFQARS